MELDVGAEVEHLPPRQDLPIALRDDEANRVRADIDDPDHPPDMVTTPHDGAT